MKTTEFRKSTLDFSIPRDDKDALLEARRQIDEALRELNPAVGLTYGTTRQLRVFAKARKLTRFWSNHAKAHEVLLRADYWRWGLAQGLPLTELEGPHQARHVEDYHLSIGRDGEGLHDEDPLGFELESFNIRLIQHALDYLSYLNGTERRRIRQLLWAYLGKLGVSLDIAVP